MTASTETKGAAARAREQGFAFIIAILVVMALREDHRAEIIATALLSIGVVAAGLLVQRKRKAEGQAAGQVALDN